MHRTSFSFLVAAGLCLLPIGVSKSSAATIHLTESTLSAAYAGPFVDVAVSLVDPTHANLTFTALTNGGYTYLMSYETAAVNVNGPFTYSPESTSTTALPGFSPQTFTMTAGSIPTFGFFNFILKQNAGYSGAVSSVSFQLTRTDGAWTDAEDVLTPNAAGKMAASQSIQA